MLHKIIRGVAPIVAFAAAMSVSGCDGNISINGKEGKPLAELDTAGKTPTGLILAGPDAVVVKDGSALKIEVAGDPHAVDALRFTLDHDTLGIMRKKGEWESKGKATVTVTLPTLEKLTLAGSGTIDAPRLSGKSEVVIAGSGTAHTAAVEARKLEVTIAGSGTYRAAGKADELELTVAGSGTADMAGLEANNAEVTVAGSGDTAFASNGTVKATVMGSGDITVTGSAKCTIKSMGSGTLHCQSGPAATGSAAPPAPPAAPAAPAAPEAPETPK
jgi:hypothetical protein